MAEPGKQRARRMAGAGIRDSELVVRLQPDEAARVLGSLLARHPALAAEAGALAREVVADVDVESIAEEVEHAMLDVDIERLNGRAGKNSWGYVEPTDAAWELLEEALAPMEREMLRRIELGFEAAAVGICQGILLGLYRCRGQSAEEVIGWVDDFPEEAAGQAVTTLVRESAAKHGRAWCLPAAFATLVPEWTEIIEQAARAGSAG